MADWKKIIVSGSTARFANIEVDGLASGVVTGAAGNLTTTTINGAGNIVATTGATNLVATGSFTGSFKGDGAGLTGLATNLTVGADSGTDTTVNLISDTLEFTGGNGISATVSTDTITYNLSTGIISSSQQLPSGIISSSQQLPTGIISSSQQLPGSIVSASAISAPTTQGQVQLTTNGVAASAININSLGTSGSPTFDSLTVTNDVTVDGSLTVNGTLTTLNTTNTEIKDQFLLLNSGSTTATDESGIIFGGSNGANGAGAALIWNGDYNGNDGRLAINNNLASNATSAAINYFVAGVFDGTIADAATAQADHRGNIRVDSSNEIWIYS